MELWATKGAVFWFLDSVPESDLRPAQHGQLIKITGFLICHSACGLFNIWEDEQ
ncbi:hypothetical protein C1H46_000958 [Malus baccata]|uniref:Uncharacterized protein n=1 Tax=Malus baccata TaxID=106549 RepID=A0A540NQU5_MALBA|nr:hypothetical protein C1H46_000958 [Malus baccata]